MYPNNESLIVVPNNKKKIKIFMSIQVCLISWMNINLRKTVGGNASLANPKHQYHVSQKGEHDSSAHKKKSGDYYEYPSLSHLIDKH